MVRTRGRLVVACLVVLGSAIAIAGGSAGNRDATAVLEATSSVSYGQDIVYDLSFKNDGNSVFTHVIFQMPAPTVDGTTLKASNPRASTSACAVDTSGSLSCDFGQLRPEDPAIAFKVVWKTPGDTSQPGRADGLVASGTWLIKEGKSTNGNETFNVTEKASLLGTSTNANLSARQKAGGYQLTGCTAPNASSLATDQALDASNNPVATSFCLPSSFVASVGSGLQSAITEPPKTDQANYAHRSDVCVAQPGRAEGLVANATWLIKEGKETNGNETFKLTEKASLLGASTNADLSARQKAGGYQLAGCTAPNASSLATDQALDAANNPVSTSFCLPSSFVASVGSGLQSAITEPPKTDQANYAHRSDVCVAQPGQDCDNPNYLSQSFSPNKLSLVFRVSAAALPKKYVITGVSHNDGTSVAQGQCDTSGFCVLSITPPTNKNPIWTILVESPTNGHFNW